MPASNQQKSIKLSALLSSTGTQNVSPNILLPASDYFDLAGEEFGRRLLLTEGTDGTQYCLRPDFTLPIAQAYMAAGTTTPATFSYRGPVFRQRPSGPTEFEQAGIELLAQTDANSALDQVFNFAHDALDIYQVVAPDILFGSVALFESLLQAANMPDVWRPRLRRRFGNPQAMGALLKRLANPHDAPEASPQTRKQLIGEITQNMLEDGLPLSQGRQPQDIADRYLEKQALAKATIPAATLDLFEQYLSIFGPVNTAIAQIENLLAKANINLAPQLDELKTHANAMADLFPKSALTFQADFSPRLHYYTGTVFELHNREAKILVSGGQYGRLLEALGAATTIPASGCAIWVKRLEQEAKE